MQYCFVAWIRSHQASFEFFSKEANNLVHLVTSWYLSQELAWILGVRRYEVFSCSQVKGDLICDICHTAIGNLPAPPPRSENGEEGAEDASSGRFVGAADVFDCIRMTWVVTIVCILFFELDITRALFTGMVVAVLYTFSCQIMRCLYTRSEDTAPPRVIPHNPHLINAAPIII